ncbi:ElaB/YgaM/YqjD family protein [Stutzerimonas balearica]|jgi:ElaB/YqjD/DUF883 family membrane-anchored ribosome-binding protein|uniref:DUF883 family protein n=1 Tax=Stutzerimonas balearica TaxID=74829 RepID=UPI00190BBC0C|nr:DUF883 family protein [Stutzerimonas balearica]MBK3748550.1 DUF883 family protein [Stutzerimonas balearica]MBK3826747.1 DUF883 family protein [Stutzerimonas balearica]MBK3856437.1 DUF883 family protein [Stutzerimonas balearica]
MTIESTNGSPIDQSLTDNPSSRPVIDKEAHRRNLQTAQNALIEEFHTLIADTERLLKHTQESAGGQTEELRNKINANLARARQALKEREGDLREQGQAAMQCTEEYVQTHPWQSIGIAAGVGFLLGLVTRR